MAIYHLHAKMYSRGKGQSAVVHSAYINGQKLKDEETGLTADYSKKRGVVFKEVMLPANAPIKFADNMILWNEVHKIEKQANAQLAREIEVALPRELSRETQIEVVREFIKKNFIKEGMCADWALHDKGDGNPHAHIMLTTRGFNTDGTWAQKEKKVYKLDESGNRIPLLEPDGKQKVRIRKGKGEEKLWERETVVANSWNDKKNIFKWRSEWALQCNQELGALNLLIDERSFANQQNVLVPTIHEGHVARAMEQKGEQSERCEYNRSVKAHNSLFNRLVKMLQEKKRELNILQESEEYVLDYLTDHPWKAYFLVSKRPDLADSKDTMLKIVSINGAAYAAASERLQNDLDVAMTAYQKDKDVERYFPSSLKAQIDVLIKSAKVTAKDINKALHKDEDVR